MGMQTVEGFLNKSQPDAASKADALVLTCIDHRYVHTISDYLRKTYDPNITYDHTILAGASLGLFNGMFSTWASTFWNHLEVALKLHQIHTVYILDHRDCGAYREFKALPDAPDPNSPDYPLYLEQENLVHQHYMDRLSGLIRESHSQLNVVTALLDLP